MAYRDRAVNVVGDVAQGAGTVRHDVKRWSSEGVEKILCSGAVEGGWRWTSREWL